VAGRSSADRDLAALLSLPKAALLEAAQQPDALANRLRHRPGRQASPRPAAHRAVRAVRAFPAKDHRAPLAWAGADRPGALRYWHTYW